MFIMSNFFRKFPALRFSHRFKSNDYFQFNYS